jgi:flagellar biosynthetic protein FliQ
VPVDQATVIYLGRQAIEISLILCAPMLGLGLLVGLAVSVIQAVTQIQDMTLTFVPKLVAVIVALALFLPWMLHHMMEFTARLMGDVSLWMR